MTRPVTLAVRDRVYEQIGKVLADEETFREVYGDVPVPVLSVGGVASHPPFEMNVAEVPSNVTVEMPSSCPQPTLNWTQEVAVTSMGATLEDATEALMSYVDIVGQVCIADRLLGNNVLFCKPQTVTPGTAFNESGGFVAACIVGIQCEAEWQRQKPVWEVIRHED